MGCKLALIAVTLFFLLSAMIGVAKADCSVPYSGSGDWVINSSVVCNDTTVTLQGNLTIESVGSLDLENVTIKFDYSSPGGIGLSNLGTLTANASVFESYGTNNYFFFSGTGSSIDVSYSVLSDIGISSSVPYKSGLYVNADSAVFSGNNFSDFTGLVTVSDGVVVDGNTFSDECFVINGSSGSVTDNVVSNAGSCYVNGDNNAISGNNLSNSVMIVKGDNNTVSGMESSGNSIGLVMDGSSGSEITNSIFNNNDLDIRILSSDVSMSGNNYTTLRKEWYLIVDVVEGNGTGVSSASVEVFDSLGNSYFEMTGSNGKTDKITVNEYFENKSKANDTVVYGNPHNITATKTGYGYAEQTVNITSDSTIEISITDFSSSEPFVLIIETPENRTYMMGDPDIESGNRIRVLVTSGTNLSSCSFVVGSQSGSMSKVSDRSFQGYFNLSGLEGVKMITVSCEASDYRTNSSSLYLTLFTDYECFSDQQCQFDESCNNNVCEQLDCGCGYATDHECIDYECCNNDDCLADEYCDMAPHTCKEVQCSCGFIQDHKCERPSDYCCVDAHCSSNQTCNVETHECITRTLTLTVTGTPVIGRTIRAYVRDHNDNTVKDVRLTLRYDETGTTETYFTNKTSETGYYAEITINELGTFSLTARRAGYFSDKESMTAQQDILLLIVYIIVIIAAIIGIVLFVVKLKKPSTDSPFKLDKQMSGRDIMLKIKNKKNEVLENIEIIDQIPTGSFISSSVRPEIIPKENVMDEITWNILRLEPGEEVDISYVASGSVKGFIVRYDGKDYPGK